ncbi:porin [Burkholderia ubonensis]|uniref:Porin n=1 Tax=Burkholderia ubonensis TaxID=101571 RepID=A0ABD6Q9T7_9BURK|nr:porin [Burkholderia ubonensis]KVM69365.1 porin [Burkholderia ubonensis]KVT36613.1 porin [Burkholderia ubonensis]KVT74472.1 porin [Burkholderia ubonensis]KVX74234.1 porin [Burkholderia ubonensis]KVZ15612.1 porin [Burkholderia ubonensis]
MKKTLIVAALSGVFATAAHAQSSVTLYGLIDAGITYTNNQGGHSAWQQSTGSVNGSRWGLRGAEDLGGGLKAIFTLENGFGINNGTLKQNGREFGRQAFVGLSHSVYGSVTLGRQYDSVVDYLGPLSLTGTQYGGTQFAHPFDNDNLNNSFRINNAVKYQSADYNGLKFGALYGFSNSSNFANNRAYSVGASYSFMGFNVAAAYMQLNNNVNGLAQAFSDPGAVTGDWTFAASRQRTWGAGLNYSFGPATAGFVFTQTRLTDSVAISAGQSGVTGGITGLSGGTRFNNYEINGRYALTPALSLAGSYTYTDGRIVGQSPKWHQFNLQAAYALSKRTDVYLQGEYQKVNSDGLPLRANINGLGTASSNNKQVAVTAGLRHRF